MRSTLSLGLGGAVLALAAGTAALAGPEERAERDAARLSAFIAQAEKGEPRNCINLPSVRSSKIIDEQTIVYEVSSRLRYVNRPPGGCPALRPSRSIITRSNGALLCSGDIARVVQVPNQFEFGACPLGEFTPYRKRG